LDCGKKNKRTRGRKKKTATRGTTSTASGRGRGKRRRTGLETEEGGLRRGKGQKGIGKKKKETKCGKTEKGRKKIKKADRGNPKPGTAPTVKRPSLGTKKKTAKEREEDYRKKEERKGTLGSAVAKGKGSNQQTTPRKDRESKKKGKRTRKQGKKKKQAEVKGKRSDLPAKGKQRVAGLRGEVTFRKKKKEERIPLH